MDLTESSVRSSVKRLTLLGLTPDCLHAGLPKSSVSPASRRSSVESSVLPRMFASLVRITFPVCGHRPLICVNFEQHPAGAVRIGKRGVPLVLCHRDEEPTVTTRQCLIERNAPEIYMSGHVASTATRYSTAHARPRFTSVLASTLLASRSSM